MSRDERSEGTAPEVKYAYENFLFIISEKRNFLAVLMRKIINL